MLRLYKCDKFALLHTCLLSLLKVGYWWGNGLECKPNYWKWVGYVRNFGSAGDSPREFGSVCDVDGDGLLRGLSL